MDMSYVTIKEARIMNGMTIREAGERLGISYASLCQYETGRKEPRFSTVQKMSEMYGVPIQALRLSRT